MDEVLINENVYKMEHENRGFAVIIDNLNFDFKLNESEKYVENYKSTFRNIGFKENEIEVCENLTSQGIKEKIDIYAQKDYTKCDCFIAVFLLSILTSKFTNGDQKPMLHKYLEDKFKNCETLKNKPKIFFLDVYKKDETSSYDYESTLFSPDEVYLSDVFFGWTSIKFKSKTSKNEPIFSKVLCETIDKCFHNEDLIEIYTEARKTLKEKYNINAKSHSTLGKSCFLNSKTNEDSSFCSNCLNSELTLSSLERLSTWHRGASFEFMGHNYKANAIGKFFSLFEPWGYDGSITSTNGGPIKGRSSHFKTERGAIEQAFRDFKKNTLQINKFAKTEQKS